jgi:hypothetical protein
MESPMRAHFLSALAISGFALAHVSTAHAWEVGTACGSSPPNWNAPNGAVVANISNGPIKAILNAVGEARTHTILSHGNGWASHATTAQPSKTVQACGFAPINATELAQGYPGYSIVNLGAMYAFLSGSQLINYQTPTIQQPTDLEGAQGTANFVWDWSPRANNNFTWQSHPSGYYVLGQTWWNGYFAKYYYEFNQYMHSGGRLNGDVGNGAGVVCTTAIGYSYANWKFYDKPSFPRPNIPKHFYSKQQTVAAGNALWNSIYNLCYSGLSWDERVFDWVASCDAAETCARAAWQTLNCFFIGKSVQGVCDAPVGNSWNAYVNATDQQNDYGAASLSPDALLGWSGLPNNDNLWAPYVDHPVQWSGEGNVYGCWF